MNQFLYINKLKRVIEIKNQIMIHALWSVSNHSSYSPIKIHCPIQYRHMKIVIKPDNSLTPPPIVCESDVYILKLTYYNGGHFLSEFLHTFPAWKELNDQNPKLTFVIPEILSEFNYYGMVIELLHRNKMSWFTSKPTFSFQNRNSVVYTYYKCNFNYCFDKDKDFQDEIISENTIYWKNCYEHFHAKILTPIQPWFTEFVRSVYEEFTEKHTLSDKIIMLKCKEDDMNLSPERSMSALPEIHSQIKHSLGFTWYSVGNEKDWRRLLATLYHANMVIFSYGSIISTNKWFLNPNASVLLLCNESYHYEFDAIDPDYPFYFLNYIPLNRDRYWYTWHTNLCPVKEQLNILHVPDQLTTKEIQQIDGYLKTILHDIDGKR